MLTLFHDYTSPSSAVAVRRLERVAADGLDVEFAGFEAIGIDLTVPVTVDVLAELESVAEAARGEGLHLRRPEGLPPTGSAHVAADIAEALGKGSAWREACYRAFWERGADLSDRSVLGALAAGVGLPGDQIDHALGDRAALARLRRRTTQHRRDGVGGVPTILAQRTLVPGLLSETDLRALAAL